MYTVEITFAPFRSDPRQENLTEARTGDWTMDRVTSSSAKSIYRLADKVANLSVVDFFLAHPYQYDIPVPKERAEMHICKSLENCGIIEETFTYL